MNVNYDRVCRLCLSSRGELLPIFPTTSSDDSEPPILASKIKDCVDVQITENDELPTNVCKKCVDNVHNWHIFKSVCERTQNKLQSLIKKDGSQLEEVNIKSEPLSDEAYDDGVVIDGAYPDSENAGTSNKVQPEGPPILASLGLTPRSDKKYVDPRMDWQRVHAILDIIQEDEVINSLQCSEEKNIVIQSDHDSESDTELMSDVDDFYIDATDGYVCKDKQLISKSPKLSAPEISQKIKEVTNLRQQSTIHTLALCPEPKDAWQLLFTDELLECIVNATNENILTNGHGFSSFTKLSEIKTLIGILYMHGIMRPTYQKCRDLWHDVCAPLCIKKAMKYHRFKFLLENISFDTENKVNQFDAMKDMRTVFEAFAKNCRESFDVGDTAVVDEIIVPVYGPCPFHYTNNKKPLISGIKLVLLVNTSSFYVNNLDLIMDTIYGPQDIVRKLVQHLAGTGRTIIVDSWFCSLSLMEILKHEYQLFCIAALNPKDDNIPPLFTSKHRKCKSYMTGFLDRDVTLTSYVTMDSKSVNILTNCPKYYKRSQGCKLNCNSVVNEYKKKQSCVEVLNVLMHYYTTMQNTNDWRLSLFFTMLNIASVNAQVMWSSQSASPIVQRRLFIRDLAVSLLGTQKGQVESSESNIAPSVPGENVVTLKRGRCQICKTVKRDRKTRQTCIICRKYACGEHTRHVCILCRV